MTYFTSSDVVELREVAGESNSVMGKGILTITATESKTALAKCSVDGVDFDLILSSTQKPFKMLDTRTCIIATHDFMTNYYLTFPSGTEKNILEEFQRVLTELVEGTDPRDSTSEGPVTPTNSLVGPSPGLEVPPKEKEQTSAVKQATDLMGALWNAGAALGAELQKKAAEDTKKLQDLGGKIAKRAQEDTKILMDKVQGTTSGSTAENQKSQS